MCTGFFITSDKGLEAFSILSVTNSVNMFLPMVGAFLRQSTIAGSMTSPVSKVISSELVSLKGFTTVPSFTRSDRAFKCLMNFSVQQLMTPDAPNFRWALKQRNRHIQTQQWPLVV